MGEGFHDTTVERGRLNGWHPDDFVCEPAQQITVDPWHPIDIQVAAVESAANPKPADAWWWSGAIAPAGLPVEIDPADHWFEDVDRPHFDPNARREEWHLDSLDGPFVRDAKSKANWIVAILQPVTPSRREKWLKTFEQVFREFEEERFSERFLRSQRTWTARTRC